jgi:predicted aminopeptidase
MMRLSETDSAALIFHELAHKLLYVAGDSAFNESFATAVEQEGVRRWLMAKGDRQAYDEYMLDYRRHLQFVDLIVQYRTRFESIYHSQEEESVKRARKAALFARMIQGHEALKKQWDATSRYDSWFSQPLNNAKLVSVLTYQNWVPAFNDMLDENNGDLDLFYEECQRLAEMTKSERDEKLTGFSDM